ncbi:MAG: RNA polymerase subunit sigma-70 [Gemmatimonadaceae bacterium]|nr:RNA polymerase subunit sigma-70 [Gemmatimonadaceae bacterium]
MGTQKGRDWSAADTGGTGSTAADRAALDVVFTAAYEELRRLAQLVRRNDPGATLSPTTLVNEAYLRLAATPAVAHTSPLHFKRIAARAMRQVVIDLARRRMAGKRGGPEVVAITLDDGTPAVGAGDDVLALDAALDDLARLSPRQAQMVECRFFGGLDVAETATLLEVSEATVLRDWRAARAWLAAELRDVS